MVLVDTSVWVTHLRTGDPNLEKLLLESEVMCHPFVVGELACGNIKNRDEILSLLQALPSALIVSQNEFLYFVELRRLAGVGIGFVDVHLLASSCLSETPLWTQDNKLRLSAEKSGILYRP
ncbi:MAG: VapC toxin family PIN domain ribonuclease [Proteobacteria bacterium]|nr:VapC toxin family PIN domain ribonuclease [Pseudomonadota bacterium]